MNKIAKHIELHCGDCREIMRDLSENSMDACVTDPPYHLTTEKKGGTGVASLNLNSPGGRARISTGFMGKAWDGGDIAFRAETWAEVLRVLKPGAHLCCFGGTRTFHRLAAAIEDAGFELRDTLMWVYGQGFPKSLDVSKAIDKEAGARRKVTGPSPRHGGGTNNVYAQDNWTRENINKPTYLTAPATDTARQWDGWGTALKPAWEPIILARKPLSESTVAKNVLKWGTGALNIDATRIATDEDPSAARRVTARKTGNAPGHSREYTHTINDRSSPEAYARERPGEALGRWPANVVHDGSDEVVGMFPQQKSPRTYTQSAPAKSGHHCGPVPKGEIALGFGDEDSAARFFYCAKASKADRAGSKHPTVKPITLLRWLARLITPPEGVILDPFAGTGTTAAAALAEGFEAVLCENEPEYQRDIMKRFETGDLPMPSRHSTVAGGSSAARLVNCPGSTAMLAKLPLVVDRDSSYAIEGTALHTVMERLVAGKVKMTKLPPIVDTHAGPVEITLELAHDALEPAMVYWSDFKSKVDSWLLETQVEFPGLKGAFGTADLIGRAEKANITYVTDWKFGAGEGVRAVYPDPDNPDYEIVNEQLMFYAAAARHTKPKLFPPGCRVILTIVQPRARDHEPITSAEVSLADLDAFAQELRAAVAMTAVADAPIKRGRWCRFQPCQTICPLHTGPLFDLETITTDKNDPVYQAVLLDILDAAPTVENLIREARTQAHLILSNGGEVPGWKLVAKRGTRQWTVDAKVLARKLKLPKSKLYDTTLKSPAGVEKMLPKGKKLPDGLATMVSPGTTIAPVSDKRLAVTADPNALAKILVEALGEND
ncbi:MAG TPA: DUF2800 domain-containing protein [Xanthobacteraceae bacterium]|nr:DUF2800 domain-containing protein [Xanthobacteraceae bacterium]